MATSPICSVAGCDKPSRRAGYCSSHHHRALRYGNPLAGGPPRNRSHKATCSIDGCDRPYYGRGYCASHWYRSNEYGDTSAGRSIRGSVTEYLETVVLTYSSDGCLTWPFARNDSGYGIIGLEGKTYKVSRYVCMKVHGEPPTLDHEAAHSCGKGHLGCVSPNHLGWKTPIENSADKVGHGTIVRGEKSPHAKLSDDKVREIRSLIGKMPKTEIGRMFGIHPEHVGRIARRERWSHVV